MRLLASKNNLVVSGLLFFQQMALDASPIAVVSLRPMFILTINTNDNNTVTVTVTGRWWLSGEREQVQPH